MKLAHKKDDREQSIKAHLEGTAKKAEANAVPKMKGIARCTAMSHDVGKYVEDFQWHLDDEKIRFEHSVCGAIELEKLASTELEKSMVYMLLYCIAGHHSGLPNGGTKNDDPADPTLCGRLKRAPDYTGTKDYSSYKDEISLELPDFSELFNELRKCRNWEERYEKYAFFTRYLFSCLTDADFIDTEEFCNPEAERGYSADFAAAEKALDEKLSGFKIDTPLKEARGRLQRQAIENSCGTENISILDMPTGSGKTLCSLKIALQKLNKTGKKRIIYVIPYTSIIEQTFNIFNDIIGKCVPIIQHHSNYSPDKPDDKEHEYDNTAAKIRRSTENWDAPIIITTSIQFFESLYHYKGSALRKMHNMADSVIIFDEIHTIPAELLQPCLRAVGYITQHLNSEAIFLSATMPDYTSLFEKFIPDIKATKLLTDKSDVKYFSKCRYINMGRTDIDAVLEKSAGYKSSLIIVNDRKTAREIYNVLGGRKYHLSTYMTPADRSCTIKEIRAALKGDEPISVVSTSLVEVGVDLDFEAVFRQLSGLDNILQSGGRCNRNGERDWGDVYIFETDKQPRGDMQRRASIVSDMLRAGRDISSQECIEEYYRRLFDFSAAEMEQNTIAKGVTGFHNIPFRSYADKIEFIKESTIGVVIDNCEDTHDLLAQLEKGDKKVLRSLQKFMVALKFPREFEDMLPNLREAKGGVFVLADNKYYSSEIGLEFEVNGDGVY
ncbi:MAG: CRISPR-associated helicase Cas3' [Oscillospiraceae bacterium]|nr:CRISPR-associated helicase Cas3' [Oscillospiraceae bacterium]